MKYLGGKSRLAKHICPILQESIDRTARFNEPFLGGNSIRQHLDIDPTRCFLSDIDRSLITLYKAILDGWDAPDEISEADYAALKAANDDEDPRTAFAAFGCSFAGKKWGGYARDHKRHTNFAAQTKRGLIKSVKPGFYRSGSYLHMDYGDRATIYCDPPYANTTGYKSGKFDHIRFWSWCRVMANMGFEVFVSESNIPDDVDSEIVWEVVRDVQFMGQEAKAMPDRLYRVLG